MKRDFVEERRGKLLEYVNTNRRADIGELALVLNTAEATIRRDLAILEKESLVHRVHGGVLRREKPSVWQSTTLEERMAMHAEEKQRIADFVTRMVHDGDSLMMDGGSTTIMIARRLSAKKNLLAVTNAPAIGELIIGTNDNSVILTGGELMKGTSVTIGSAAEHSLRQYRTDKTIIGVSGILADTGFFSASPQEAEIKRLMAMNSSETIVVADSSKIGTRAFCFVCDFALVDKVITDQNISGAALKTMIQRGVEVYSV